MDKIINTLKNLGFSSKESDIYVSLVELGKASYTDLARATGLRRNSLYSLVAPLQDKGIVSYDAEEQMLIPLPPEELFTMIQNKVLKLHRLLPQLKDMAATERVLSRFKLYRGAENIKQMLLEGDQLPVPKKDRVRLVISDVQTWNSFWRKHDPQFLEDIPKKRKEMGYKARILFSGKKEAPFDKDQLPDLNMEIKFLPESYKQEFDVEIRPNLILLNDITSEQPYGIKIVSTELATAFSSFFNFTWDLYRP